jgi:hypothetical protein
MSTIINNPSGTGEDGSSGSSVAIVAIVILLIAAGILFFVYGLPAIKNMKTATPSTTNIQVEIPATSPQQQ